MSPIDQIVAALETLDVPKELTLFLIACEKEVQVLEQSNYKNE